MKRLLVRCVALMAISLLTTLSATAQYKIVNHYVKNVETIKEELVKECNATVVNSEKNKTGIIEGALLDDYYSLSLLKTTLDLVKLENDELIVDDTPWYLTKNPTTYHTRLVTYGDDKETFYKLMIIYSEIKGIKSICFINEELMKLDEYDSVLKAQKADTLLKDTSN